MEPKFKVGDRVQRIEEREVTGAVVTEIDQISETEFIYMIDYDEGGNGSWPEDSLAAE